MKAKKIALSLLSLVALSIQTLSAQGVPPPQGGATGAPIDSAAIVLLFAVAYYGYKRNKLKLQPVKA